MEGTIRTDEQAGRLNAAYELGFAAGFEGRNAASSVVTAYHAGDPDELDAAYRAGYDTGREERAEYDLHEAQAVRA